MDLLTTKLYMPPVRPNLVVRRRLQQRLDEGLQHGRFLTLVAAPAGYGKSTLVAAWLQQRIAGSRPLRAAWLALDDEDNEPLRFFAYLVAALQSAGLPLPATAAALRQLTQLPAVDGLVTRLLNELADAQDPPAADQPALLLVLDDYHKIRTAAIHDALHFWLAHAPRRLHLVLITREDPPLPLARWRAGARLTDIRAADLRFTPAEAATFLGETMGLQLAAADVAALEQRTEGWIAGLQLAAIALQAPRAAADTASFIAAFSGSHHYVIDYLVEEVLRQQPEPVRAFLRHTAVLNRLNADLCNAVTGRDDGQAMLAHLARAHLFLVPLDDRRRWYRYHHLLADSLRADLDPAQRAAAHRRAAAWFADQALYEEAVEHAHAAGDAAELLRLVRLAAEPTFQAGELVRLAGWLRRVPPAQLQHELDLGVYWLLSLILTGRSHEAPAAIAALEQQHDGRSDPRQHARLLVIKAWVADITDAADRVALAQAAAAALGDDDPLFSTFVAVPLGHAHLAQGQLPPAVDAFRRGLALAPLQGPTFVRLSLLGNLVQTLNHAGRRHEALAICQRALDELGASAGGQPLTAGRPLAAGPPLTAGIPFLLRAWLHYDADELDQARADAARGRDLLRRAFQETLLAPLEVELQVWLHAAAGETEAAWTAVRAGQDRAAHQAYRQAARLAARLAADLHLRHGQPAAARRWADAQPILQPPPRAAASFDLAYLTYARLLLAEDRAAAALPLLARLADAARAGGWHRSLISVLLLQAVASADPRPCLLEALQLAAAERYLRLFVDECAYPAHGAALRALLQDDAVRQAAPPFVAALRAALPPAEADAPSATAPSAALPEPLTEQEQVILRLLADGLSNKEIAAQLVITVGTAKWHVHNLYQKLGVSSRAQAVARALALLQAGAV